MTPRYQILMCMDESLIQELVLFSDGHYRGPHNLLVEVKVDFFGVFFFLEAKERFSYLSESEGNKQKMG